MRDGTGLRARTRRRNRQAIVEAALRLFAARGFEATSVEQIAAEAEVAPRTFYRYFPAKEDVLFDDPGAEEVLRRALAERRAGEPDARRVARAMLSAMLADEERVGRVRALLETTPSLRGPALHRMARTADVVAAELLAGRPRSRPARLRAQVLAQAVGAAVRVAFFDWMDDGRRSSPWGRCELALRALDEALGRPEGRRRAGA